MTREEAQALKTLKRDNSITIIPADKGCATVVMNKQDYKQKVMEHLADHETYQRENNNCSSDLRKIVN